MWLLAWVDVRCTRNFVGACRYLELEGSDASHVKTTLVRQGARSRYVLTEAALGAALSRHDLGIEQVLSALQLQRCPPVELNENGGGVSN